MSREWDRMGRESAGAMPALRIGRGEAGPIRTPSRRADEDGPRAPRADEEGASR